MQLTLSAILIVVFFFPGYLFRKGFFNYPYTSHVNKRGSLDEVSSIIFWSIILHLIFYIVLLKCGLIESFIRFFSLHFQEYLVFKDTADVEIRSSDLTFTNVVLIFFIFWTASVYLGLMLNKNIREFKLDTKIRFFKFKNDWYYYLRGKVLDYPDVSGNSDGIMVLLDILCRIDSKPPAIYSGILHEYNLDSNGELINLFIKGAVRRDYYTSEESDYIPISSNYLSILPQDIINVNFRYIKLKRDSSDEIYTESMFIRDLLQLWYDTITLYLYINSIYQLIRLLIIQMLRLGNWIIRRPGSHSK